MVRARIDSVLRQRLDAIIDESKTNDADLVRHALHFYLAARGKLGLKDSENLPDLDLFLKLLPNASTILLDDGIAKAKKRPHNHNPL